MYPVSARFAAEVTRSGHLAVAGLDLQLADGSRTALPLISESVTEDATAAERWTLDATIVADGLVPLDPAGPVAPGAVLRPWRGIQFPDGTVEPVPLGVHLAGEPVADHEAGTVALRGEGRSTAVAGARLVTAWPVEAGTLLSDLVSDLLADRLPGCPPTTLACEDVTLPATFIPGGADSDPWQALVSEAEDSPGLVTAVGRRLWFDADGIPVLHDLVWTGEATTLDGAALLLTARTSIDASRTYGGVCVTSNGLTDTDPLTAVRYADSPPLPMLATRVYFAQMDALTTQEAIDAAADSLLLRVTGVRGQAAWTQPPNPALNAGDRVEVTGGVMEGLFEIARITTSLTSGAQQVEAMERVL